MTKQRIYSEKYSGTERIIEMSQEDFNETSILNDTELINGTIPSWRTDYEGDWWTILIVSSGIMVKRAPFVVMKGKFSP